MTLVAQIMVHGAPFLIGDALASTETISGMECELPLIGEINSILAAKLRRFEVKLTQKLYIFDGRLAVGFAGPVIQAERVISVLRDLTKRQRELQLKDIESELDSIDPDRIDKLEFVGFLLRGVAGNQVSSNVFARRVTPADVKGFGRCYFAGTGAAPAKRILESNGTLPGVENNPKAIVPLLGALLNNELTSGSSIDQKWGGAFEAVAYSHDSQRLEKVGNVLHTFWIFDPDSPGAVTFQGRFYKTIYFDDALLIRSAEFEKLPDRVVVKSNRLTVVPPLFKSVEEYDKTLIGPIGFDYEIICCHVWIKSKQKATPEAAIMIGAPEGGSIEVRLAVNADGSGHLEIPASCISALIEQLQLP
jgi:hypothetical protein